MKLQSTYTTARSTQPNRIGRRMTNLVLLLFAVFALPALSQSPHSNAPYVAISFDGSITGDGQPDIATEISRDFSYQPGISGRSLHSNGGKSKRYVRLDGLNINFDHGDDFTVQIWVQANTDTSQSSVLASNSDLSRSRQPYNQGRYPPQMRNEGWSLFTRADSWGFNIGDGNRNYHYQPHEGTQCINDGEWHQITFSHSADEDAVRVYFDGHKKAVLYIADLRNSINGHYPVHIGADGRGDQSEFDAFAGSLDEFAIWDRVLPDSEVAASFGKHRPYQGKPQPMIRKSLKVMSWNIWHGGHHFTRKGETGHISRGDIWDKPELVNNYDGAERIAEIIVDSGADIILLQESYGSGPRIASLLNFEIMIAGGLFSNQVWGPNITLLSRFPIEKPFVRRSLINHNGGALIKISKDQQIVAFSNWYSGTRTKELTDALNHWHELIANADSVPVFFGGDFNARSHLNGGSSRHSRIMLENKFTDSFHGRGQGYENRIDFLYFQGAQLRPKTSIMQRNEIVDYPSDHPLVLTEFELEIETQEDK